MNWNQYPLSSLAIEFINGGTPSTKVPAYWEGDIPWITGADVEDRTISTVRKYINSTAVANSSTHIVPKNAVLLVTRTGVGKLVKANCDIAISQDLTGIVLKKSIDPDYAIYAIQSKIKSLARLQQGAIIKGLLRKDVEQLNIPLPPFSEQHRIVEILDQADALRKKRTEANKVIENIMPALFYKMFGDPFRNDKGYSSKPLGKIIEINPRSPLNVSQEELVSFVPMADIDEKRGRIVGKQSRKFSDVSKGFTYFENGDVLFAKITPCMQNGKSAIAQKLVNGKGFGSTEYFVLRPNNILYAEYLFGLVRLKNFRLAAATNFTGTAGQQRVPLNFLSNFKIPIPNGEIQTQFKKAFHSLEKVATNDELSTDKLNNLFKVLLSRAFSGDLTSKWREAHMKELLEEMEEQAKELK